MASVTHFQTWVPVNIAVPAGSIHALHLSQQRQNRSTAGWIAAFLALGVLPYILYEAINPFSDLALAAVTHLIGSVVAVGTAGYLVRVVKNTQTTAGAPLRGATFGLAVAGLVLAALFALFSLSVVGVRLGIAYPPYYPSYPTYPSYPSYPPYRETCAYQCNQTFSVTVYPLYNSNECNGTAVTIMPKSPVPATPDSVPYPGNNITCPAGYYSFDCTYEYALNNTGCVFEARAVPEPVPVPMAESAVASDMSIAQGSPSYPGSGSGSESTSPAYYPSPYPYSYYAPATGITAALDWIASVLLILHIVLVATMASPLAFNTIQPVSAGFDMPDASSVASLPPAYTRGDAAPVVPAQQEKTSEASAV